MSSLNAIAETIAQVQDLIGCRTSGTWSFEEVFSHHLPALRMSLSRRVPFTEIEPCLAVTCRWMEVAEELITAVKPYISAWEPSLTIAGKVEGTFSAAAHTLWSTVSMTVAVDHFVVQTAATSKSLPEHLKLTLNRRLALNSPKLRDSLFGQVFSLIGPKSPTMFLSGKRLWSVSFVGEGADDVGGPYREALSEICSELMSTSDLFIPTQNARTGQGSSQDFVVNPFPSGFVDPRMYIFIGRLMAACVRGGEALPLHLPSFFWKRLVGEQCTLSDVERVDLSAVQVVQLVDHSDETLLESRFECATSVGSIAPLFEESENTDVSRENCHCLRRLVVAFKTRSEGSPAWDLLVNSFHQILPPTTLIGIKWREMEQLVCGLADFDVDELFQNCRFEGLEMSDRRITFLQSVLKGFSRHERGLFARFVSGRERLPSGLRLKIIASVSDGTTDDEHLPTASTCFFWLSLPNYSAQHVLRSKLLFAIQQCHDIDADFRVRNDEDDGPTAVVQLGADDEEFEDYHHLL